MITRLQAAQQQVLEQAVVRVEQQRTETQTLLHQAQEKNIHYATQIAVLETENSHLITQLTEQKQEIEHMQEKLTIQFKNLANDLLEEKSKKFTDQNQVQLTHLLKPLGEKIQAFEKQVAQANQASLANNVALRTELKHLNELNTQITKEAEHLAKAIKGDTKIQGYWGEFILESILEKSGLVKDREYVVQSSFVTPAGKRYQPDVIMKLPDQKHIIIDAKVSLVHYEQCCNTDHEATRALALKQHIQSIRKHIQVLSEKNYAMEYTISGLDFVLLFIPIDPAFSLAIQHAPSLFQEAYDKNIVLVSPTTLLATVRTIAHLWKHAYQNQHALEIASQSGALYDKFVSFVEDLKQLGRQVQLTQKIYLETMKKLYEGRGNLITRAHQIKMLGARTSKTLDQKLVDRATEPVP